MISHFLMLSQHSKSCKNSPNKYWQATKCCKQTINTSNFVNYLARIYVKTCVRQSLLQLFYSITIFYLCKVVIIGVMCISFAKCNDLLVFLPTNQEYKQQQMIKNGNEPWRNIN